MFIGDFKPQDVEWCPTCREHEDGKCDGCHSDFLVTDQRYRAASHHFHPGLVGNEPPIPGFYSIHQELCVDCYRKDFEAFYKKQQLKAPELPDRGMDPRFFALQQIQKERNKALAILTSSQDRPLNFEEQEYLRSLVHKAIK